MLQEPPVSPYDLQFNFLGYPVRVFWGFWAAAILLGWSWTNSLNGLSGSPGTLALMLIWVASLFLSILVHELGHTFAFKYYGIDSHIVLYHMGGLAIPGGMTAWDGARRRTHIGAKEQLVISAAGPALQLLLGMAVVGCGYALNVQMEVLGFNIGPENGNIPESIALFATIDALIFPSIAWALLNLVPVLPLDGGQIMRSLLQMSNVDRPNNTALIISIGCAAFIGIWGMMSGFQFLGLMMMFLAFSNFQTLQMQGRY